MRHLTPLLMPIAIIRMRQQPRKIDADSGETSLNISTYQFIGFLQIETGYIFILLIVGENGGIIV